MNHLDRHGTPLENGQTIRLQQPVGRHGETRVVSGTIEALYDTPPGVTLLLNHDLVDRRFNGHTQVSQLVKAGERLYATLPACGLEVKDRVGSSATSEAWVEVMQPAPEMDIAPAKSGSRMRP